MCGLRAGDKSTDTYSDESVASRDTVDGRHCELGTCLAACGVLKSVRMSAFLSVVFVQHRCFLNIVGGTALFGVGSTVCVWSPSFTEQESRPCSISGHVKPEVQSSTRQISFVEVAGEEGEVLRVKAACQTDGNHRLCW